jgi:Ran GTPase-activating protein (RanGAP) involved in mRNA processing and transport
MNAVDNKGNSRILYCLEDINLSNNAAGPEGAAAIGMVMPGNRVLRKINCKNCFTARVSLEMLSE